MSLGTKEMGRMPRGDRLSQIQKVRRSLVCLILIMVPSYGNFRNYISYQAKTTTKHVSLSRCGRRCYLYVQTRMLVEHPLTEISCH